MPPFPGEDRLVTVYADIHYYFSQPSIRPILHRFDKASYFYIYYNSTRQTTRLEVANNPGSAEQDAFNGYLDKCRVINSYKFPTLVTILVDPTGSSPTSPSSPRPGKDPNEWRLANTDPRDQGKHMYRLHTLDVYFWAQEDAKQVTDILRRYIDPSQLDIDELDSPEQEKQAGEVDPVVQNLENVAISDPAYRNGQTRNAQGEPQSRGANLPPPPPPQSLSHAALTPSPRSEPSHSSTPLPKKSTEKENYAPLAYNPAAPPAPEPIAHREDTPPPADGPAGTGLAAAAMEPYTPGMPQSAPYTGTPGPMSNPHGHYGSPQPQSATQTSTTAASSFSFAGPPSQMTSSPPSTAPQQSHQQSSIAGQTYAPPPSQHQPAETPSADFYPTHHASLTHIQPQYADYLTARAPAQTQTPSQGPVGGYSNYNYEGNPQQQAQYQPQQHQQQQYSQHYSGENPYDVHQQLYRPTEHEHSHSHGHSGKQQSQHRPSSSSASGGKQSRAEAVADKAEKKAGKLWKKIQNF